MKRATPMVGLLVCWTAIALPAQAGTDRVAWMIERLLSGNDVLDYELALDRFVKLSDPRVLPTLLKLTDSPAITARAEAAGVLWHYNTKEIREKLVEMGRDPEAEVRIEAAKALCLMKYSGNLAIITDELKSHQQAIRSRALRALAVVGGDAARKAAEVLRHSKSPLDRVWSAYALYRLGAAPKAQLQELEHQLLGFPRAAWLPGKVDPDEDDLARAARLAQAHKEPRLAAAGALARIADQPALAVLVRGTADRATLREPNGARQQLLHHPDQAAVACADALDSDQVLVRLGAAQVAGRLALRTEATRARLAAALGRAVGDRSRLVRLAALRALAAHRLGSQTSAIRRALQAADPDTRRGAALALGAIGQDGSLDALLRALNAEASPRVRRSLYRAVGMLKSPQAVEPMFARLKKLYKQRRTSSLAAEELTACSAALASAGEPAAVKVLRMLPKLEGEKRKLMIEVLAKTGSASAIDFFMDALREAPPQPDAQAVRFFDSLDERFIPKLQKLIESETAMWIRVILARSLYRLGRREYGRGILWGLKHDEVYYRRLAAAAARGLKVPGSVTPLIRLLGDEPETAWYAARALMSDGSPKAIGGLVAGLQASGLRQRRKIPVTLFWEGERSGRNPFAKEVDNERVWVLFAEDRIGGKLDLFLTWSADGRTWTDPVFTGLTSFSDPSGRVAPPTFSLKVRERKITIALTRTFAQSNTPGRPRLKTLQRVHHYGLRDFFKDRDNDGLKDQEEATRFTQPGRADSDGDGLLDGEDKNPLARPADPERDGDLLKVLAFSYALLVAEDVPHENRLLVVEDPPGERRPPEMPTWPWLVLHLRPEQIASLWRETGCGYPRVRFGATDFHDRHRRASQTLVVRRAPGDNKKVEVGFRRRGGQWVVSGYREAD